MLPLMWIDDWTFQISRIPNIAGAVDGTHVPIKAPKTRHEDYFNRKHFYSYILQGVVDSTGLFLSVSTGYPGSLHDARVLRLSRYVMLQKMTPF